MSLPLWERGLKSYFAENFWAGVRSLPLWERGLKSVISKSKLAPISVAPLVGAWIEIFAC